MFAPRCIGFALIFAALGGTGAVVAQQTIDEAATERAVRHQSDEWLLIAPHLPDPQTASADALQSTADVLRARRFPEDALEYYQYAMKRGGDEAVLCNRIGLTMLEMHHPEVARIAFRRAVKVKPKYAEAWNNLGASEYSLSDFRASIADYLRAVKLNKKAATFHSNLGTSYFEVKDYESARQQFTMAMKLDRSIFQSSSIGGVQAHVMSPSDRGRFCFEMARLAAKQHDDGNVLLWLARASETGFDTRSEMLGGKEFKPYWKDPRVTMIIHNAHAMRTGQIADAGLPPAVPEQGH